MMRAVVELQCRQRLPSMMLTLRKYVTLGAESEQHPVKIRQDGVQCFYIDESLLIFGSRRTTKISSRGGIDCINEQFCQKRLLQIRNAANVKGLLASGLVIDRGHKNDGQIPA
jgi:hypothetical protein